MRERGNGMQWTRWRRRALIALSLASGAMAGAQAPSALATLSRGEWVIHEIGSPQRSRAICVRDPALLVQLEHGPIDCRRQVIAETRDGALIRYRCPGLGGGTTRVTVESASLVRLQTQGLIRGAPFDHDYEARFRGPCR